MTATIAGVCLLALAWQDPKPSAPADKPAAEAPAASEHKAQLHPGPPEPVDPAEIEAAIKRGVAFLLKDQNRDGTWGSAERTKNLNIMAGIGSLHAFRIAVTALAVSALTEVGGSSESVRQAIERGEEALFRELPRVRRDQPVLIYNVWTHAYGIQALVHMHHRLPDDKARQARIEALIRQQFEMLTRYESAQGGWGYYDFGAGTQRPNSASTSFVNAAVLEAFDEARQIGLEPPGPVLKRAIHSLRLQRNPDFTYIYDLDLRHMPVWGINRAGGSLGRSQACNLALRLWGDKAVTNQVMKDWLDRLITRNGWLDMGRKRPIPHESYFMVAGYFYYFGHYYGTLCIGQLDGPDRPFYQDHLARILLKVQERDGSWWDYPLYNYHQQYGTAFAIMSLGHCRKPVAEAAAAADLQKP